MCLTEQTQGLCPRCGKPLQAFNEPPAIEVSTVLKQRYLLGAVHTVNGEGYTYAAFDMLSNEPVFIREFFPKGKALRLSDGVTVDVLPEDRELCLPWVSDFIALHQKLKSMGSTNCISPCKDLFDENDTAYAVIEMGQGKRTLQQYLNEYFDVLSWKQAEFLLTPLLYGLSGLNAAGITHCGVCPENLTVDEKGKVRLTRFCIPQARTVGSGMQHELYGGYSAPEQYVPDGEIGEWTDVYAFCAILYRVLTGTTVPKANSRAISNLLTAPRELNSDIPQAVSEAIILGLDPDPLKRTRSFKALLFNLYNEKKEEEESFPAFVEVGEKQTAKPVEKPADKQTVKHTDKTIVIPAVGKVEQKEKKERRFTEERKTNEPMKKPKVPVALLVLLIALPVVLALFFLAYGLLLGGEDTSSSSGNVSFMDGISYEPSSYIPSDEESMDEVDDPSSITGGIEVDDFVGKYFADIENNAVYTANYTFTAVHEYDDTVEKGYIIEQSIAPKTIVPKGESIEFLVSKGSRYFVLPSITDGLGKRKTGEAYAAELSAVGIECIIKQVETNDYAEGKVIDLDLPHAVGSKIDLENPETVTVLVAKAKEIDPEELFGNSSDTSSAESEPSSEESSSDILLNF